MPLPHITIYAPFGSARLRYALDWLFTERLGFTYTFTTSETQAGAAACCISYGARMPGAVTIAAAALLQETGITAHEAAYKSWQGLHTFYFVDERDADIPFDLLSGIFFFLSRYEEYYPDKEDRHGRYRYRESVLAREEFDEDYAEIFNRPVVDEWVEYLRRLLEQRWHITIPKPAFRLEISYDIDIAWAYRHKGFKRLLGGALRDAASLKLNRVAERFSARDPYDAFGWMARLHERTGIEARYFILAAEAATAFDKNISPHHPAMQALVKQLGDRGPVGLHPSYFSSEKPALLAAEKALLEQIIDRPIHTSRQHYIRLRLPGTYRRLISQGITDDYSMGYTTITGFRAGTSHSFAWYDIAEETATSLRIHPFSFMDTTARIYMGLTADEAFQNIGRIRKTLEPLGGVLSTIFHNFSLGTDRDWHGWREGYERFLSSGV